jgi:TM2 domain-containing membrane protein YozV
LKRKGEKLLRKIDKNTWLNLVIGLFGFYFTFSLLEIGCGKFITGQPVMGRGVFIMNWTWLICFLLAIALTTMLLVYFCKPRKPFLFCLAILTGGILSMYSQLWYTLVNLDGFFHRDGLAALRLLLPHGILLGSTILSYFIIQFSNRITKVS